MPHSHRSLVPVARTTRLCPAPRVALLAAVVLSVVVPFGSGCQRPPKEKPNVLLISIDTLRADHIGAYGYRLDTTPAIDALAKRGVRFADTTVAWPKTWPSMAAMVTGKAPQSNGILLRPRRPLPDENVTMAEALRANGYATGAVVANVNLARSFGFDQGFEQYVESWAEEAIRQTGSASFRNVPGLVKRFTNGKLVTDQAVSMLDTLGNGKEKPFFLWLHYIDPHGPYVPPPAYATFFEGEHPPYPVPLEDLPPYQLQIDPATGVVSNDIGFYMTQYDREIRSLDDQIGRLLKELDARGLTRDTLIVFTADHGESLAENAYYLEHGDVPYQTTAAVPMILALDGRFRRGRVVERPVGLVDLYATILGLTKTPAPQGLASTSLVPVLEGDDAATPPHVFMISGKYEPWQLSIREGPWKLVLLRAPQDREWLHAPERALYDLSRDPHEQHDVLTENAPLAAALEKKLLDWFLTTPRFTGGAATDLKKLDAHTQEMLRALGYLE